MISELHLKNLDNAIASCRGLLGSSLKRETDATLFLEITLRGHDLSKLRDEQTTAEILKIG